MSDATEELGNKPFAAQLSNVYLSILALFCFKLFVKLSLNLLTYFYIVRGNRKEAARISAEFYDYGQQHSEYWENPRDSPCDRMHTVQYEAFRERLSRVCSSVYIGHQETGLTSGVRSPTENTAWR